MTRDVAGCRARQKHDSARELDRFSVAPQHPTRLGCGPAAVDAALDTTQALRLDPARRDTIDPNLLFGELDRGRAGQPLHPGLGCQWAGRGVGKEWDRAVADRWCPCHYKTTTK